MCRKFAEPPEEEEEEEEPPPPPPPPPPDYVIFVDMKTASVFQLERADAIKQEFLTPLGKDNAGFVEATKDPTEREEIIKNLKSHPTLGVATQLVVTSMVNDLDEVKLTDADKVANLWGVALKKRPKNKKGEELIFIDPKSGATGELARKTILSKGVLNEFTNEFNKLSLKEAETGAEAREEIIVKIREVFNIKFG